MRRSLRLLVTATVALAVGVTFSAAAAFPTRAIDLYIGSAPSGSTDALGRVLARSLESEIGVPVIVHNTPGAGGAVMATLLRNSDPDGHSLGMTISHAYTGNPLVMPGTTPYTVDDFRHLASVSKGQCALVTSTRKPWRTLADLVAAAKSGAEPIFASQSPLTRLVADYIAAAAGVRFRIITVQGGGEIMQSVLGGHADFGFSGGPHIGYVAAGQMRVLASVEDERLLTSPEVPTLKELGYDIASCSTFVVSAPPDLPADVEQVLSGALRNAIASSEMQTLIGNLQYPQYYLGPDEITAALENESRMLERAVATIDRDSDGAAGRLSPAFMPIVAVVLGLGAALLMLISHFTHARPAATPSALPGTSWKFISLSILVMTVGFVGMSTLGYLTGGAAIVGGFLALGRTPITTTIGTAFSLPLLLWLLFSFLLGFPLP